MFGLTKLVGLKARSMEVTWDFSPLAVQPTNGAYASFHEEPVDAKSCTECIGPKLIH